MNVTAAKSNLLKRLGLFILTILFVVGGSLYQQRVLQVNAAVQVLLVSRTAIAFGNVFPGQDPSETYTVQLDTSANSATYVTTLDPLPGLQNMCPFLNIHSIDSPPEPDTLANATLTRPGDVLDNWQVQFNVPGIQGELSQDHTGGIIIQGGNYGCKITITTTADPGTIIICKQSVGGTGTFNFAGDLGNFAIQTATSSAASQTDPCGNPQPCPTGTTSQTADRGGTDISITKCITTTTVTNTNSSTVTTIVSSGSNSGGNVIGSGGGDVNNGTIITGSAGSSSTVQTTVNNINSTVNLGSGFDGNQTFSNTQPGTYNVTESTSTGWTLASLSCSDPTNNTTVSGGAATITLDSGETVICTFVNTKTKGSIVIHKQAIGGDGKFSYIGDLGSFSLQTVGGTAAQSFNNLNDGTYKVSETAQSGWQLTALLCQDPNNTTTILNNSAIIKIKNGQTVNCTFTNTLLPKDKITIQKTAVGGNGTFNFTGDLGSFSLQTSNGTAGKVFDNLTDGSYKVLESAVSGWKFSTLVCSDPTNDTVVNGSTATIKVSNGENVTCIFTNTKNKS